MKDLSVTYTKAIGIILMVVGHSHCPQVLWNFIYMFHMPLFFIMAGFCFKEKYLAYPLEYLRRKIKGIYWPFIKWSLLILLMHNIFCKYHIYDSEFGYNGVGVNIYTGLQICKNMIMNICLMDTTEQLLGGGWFLRVLFLCSVISYILLLIKNTPVLTAIKVGVVLVLAIILQLTGFHISSIGLDSLTMMSVALFLVGYLFKQIRMRILRFSEILFILVMVIVGSIYWNGQLLNCSVRNIIPYVITSISATWALYSAFHYMKKTINFLEFVGNNTLTILALHFLSFKLVSLILIYIYQLPIGYLGSYPTIDICASEGWWIVYSFIGLALPLLIVYITQLIKNNNG